ncbi:MAG: alpha/beta hydrolase [Acidobacteriota bacterium]
MTDHRAITRRGLVKWGLLSTAFTMPFGRHLAAQVGGRHESELFPGLHLPGGGQLDVRLTVDPHNSDPDIVEIASRLKPYNVESWGTEYRRAAEKNEQLADQFAQDGRKVTASEYYLRAAGFYSTGCWPMPEDDPRMLPMVNKLVEVTAKANTLVPPPFERVEVPYDNTTLTAYFTKPRGPERRFPTVFTYGGADTIVTNGAFGAAYNARGMAHLAMDSPGQGLALRLKHLHAPPDAERIGKAVIDYLVTRSDVDANRIGIYGLSMGGYGAPRCASGDKRIKACAVSSAAYSLREDIFDYFPPIQERVRWIIGANDLAGARKRLADFTLEGRAHLIECPMLIGYSKDDRIMDPQGAFNLYKAAVNSRREMVEGIGHNQAANAGGPRPLRPPVIPDWMAKQLQVDIASTASR